MPHPSIKQLEEKVDLLIRKCRLLESENAALRELSKNWDDERAALIEKNTVARTRVEAMIQRLKSIHNEPENEN